MEKLEPLVRNADGDEFSVHYDVECREWRAEQFTGLHKNYLHIPALLHAKSRSELLADLRQHRCA